MRTLTAITVTRILVESPDGHTMLIDAGGSNDETQVDPRQVGLKTVVPYLHYLGISRIDASVVTRWRKEFVDRSENAFAPRQPAEISQTEQYGSGRNVDQSSAW